MIARADGLTVRSFAVRLMVVAGLVCAAGGPGRAAGTVYINPGEDIQAQVNANGTGTTFILRSGVHRMQTIRPKDNDVFLGESGASLNGSRMLTSFTRAGAGGGGGSSVSYLSDRTWSYAYNGWGPIEKDRSNGEQGADGGTIRLNGTAFTKGLGVHAPSDVRFNLAGTSCTTFSASVGMDDEVGGNGDVAFQVWADGVRLWDSGLMTGNSATQTFNVPISGRSELKLIVWEAANASYDHADWADARLTCAGSGGGYYVASGQTQQGTTKGSCQTGFSRCIYPEQLFIDDVGLEHVATLGEVGPGKFYFDYVADQIYFADDPTGRKVEASVTTSAFEPTADYVTISGLLIEKFAGVAQQGAINGIGRTGWVVTNNNVRWNHGVGIRVGTGAQVRANYASYNGQLGIVGVGDNILIENNDIGFNNTAKFWANWEAGGTKFVETRNLVVRGNYVHSNGGPGLWTDDNNINTLYENNTCDDNERMGIFVEVSYDTIIRNNTLRRNGLGFPEYIWGAGILVSASPNVQIYGNYLDGNADGIGAAQQNRGSGWYGTHEIWNLYVHDNTVLNTLGWTGLVQDTGDNALFYSRNNWFVNNTYSQSTTAYHFVWLNAERSAAEWASFGQK
jgi:parallel beta-helix repeat protein